MFRRRLDTRCFRSKCVYVWGLASLFLLVWVTHLALREWNELTPVARASGKPLRRTPGRKQVFTTQILAWTTKSGKSKWIPNNLRSLGCQVSNCKITEERSKLNKSRVVIFHSKDVDPKRLPRTRVAGQLWVYLNHEPPTQTSYSVVRRLSPLINLTVSYRTDSDIYAPVYDLAPRERFKADALDELKGKRKMVTWLVSHCKTSSNREGYVKRLKEFISVDIWGKCGKNFTKCPKLGREDCYKKLAEEYKFYLAFENSLCKDYVSEKLYLAMYAGMIPVVFGAANYSQILPPNSFINALDFDGPSSLAKFLLKVASDDDLFQSFLEWRDGFTVVQRRYKWLCDLCAMVKNKPNKEMPTQNLTKWWFDEAQCKTWSEKH